MTARLQSERPTLPVSCSALELSKADAFFTVFDLANSPVHVKCEGFNIASSIKLKPALRIISDLEAVGQLRAGRSLIESSSGNLGIALSMVAARKGYRFICVTDPNASQQSVKIIRALGAEVIVVQKRDKNGGFLGTRIDLIHSMCREDPNLLWINQYANESNWKAHYHTTGPEILEHFPRVDWLVIGAGTTGTLMGCARYFRTHAPKTRIIAVDAEGSVTFGKASGRRLIPGLGTSRAPEILDASIVDDVVLIPERETIAMCRRLARQGTLVGGSTGTVLAGIARLRPQIASNDVVVTISPDFGEKYLDTIYDDSWVSQHFPGLLPL